MAASTSSTVVIKAKCGTDCRRFEIDMAMSLAELWEQLYVIYDLTQDDTDQLKYVDEEGDLVTLTADADLKRVTKDMSANNKALRLVLLSRFRKTVTFVEPLKNLALAVSPKDGLAALTDDAALNANGEPWDTADVQLLQQCRDEEILAMLRDISLYIQSREGGGSPNFIRSAVKNRKRLITPGAMEKQLLMDRESVVEAVCDVESEDDEIQRQNLAERFKSPSKSPSNKGAPPAGDVRRWGLQDVSNWLVDQGYTDLCSLFQDNEIDGDILGALDHEALSSMGMKVAGKRIKLLKDIRLLTTSPSDGS